MVKVKAECQKCSIEREFEGRGVFIAIFEPAGADGVLVRYDSHHVAPAEVMQAAVAWFFTQIASPNSSQPESHKQQMAFLEFLKKIGVDVDK